MRNIKATFATAGICVACFGFLHGLDWIAETFGHGFVLAIPAVALLVWTWFAMREIFK